MFSNQRPSLFDDLQIQPVCSYWNMMRSDWKAFRSVVISEGLVSYDFFVPSTIRAMSPNMPSHMETFTVDRMTQHIDVLLNQNPISKQLKVRNKITVKKISALTSASKIAGNVLMQLDISFAKLSEKMWEWCQWWRWFIWKIFVKK